MLYTSRTKTMEQGLNKLNGFLKRRNNIYSNCNIATKTTNGKYLWLLIKHLTDRECDILCYTIIKDECEPNILQGEVLVE